MTYDVAAELYIDGAWVDITRLDDDTHVVGDITVTRGASDEQNDAAPATVSFDYLDNNLTLDDGNPLSAYYRKVGVGTPLRITQSTPEPTYYDTFTRNSVNSWGTPTVGGAWNTLATSGTSADFQVNGSQGTHSVGATNDYRLCYMDELLLADQDIYAEVSVAEPTGAAVEPTLFVRGTGQTSYLMIRVVIAAGNAVSLRLISLVASSSTTLATATTSVTHAAATTLKIRAQVLGDQVRARVWQGASEPSTWQLDVTQTTVNSAGWSGIRSGVETGNTNVKPVVFTWDNFEITPLNVRAVVELAKYEIQPGDLTTTTSVRIEGAGLLRTLDQGQKALRSALFRAIERASPLPSFWWNLETGNGRVAESFPSTLPGGPALIAAPASAGNNPDARNVGVVGGAVVGPPGGAGAIDVSGGGELSVAFPALSVNGPLRVEVSFVFSEPVDALANGQILRLSMGPTLIGIFAQDTAGAEFVIDASTDTSLFTDTSNTIVDDGAWHRIRLDLAPSGGSIDYEVSIDGVVIFSGVTATWSPATNLVISPTGDLDAVSMLAVWDGTAPTNVDTFDAHDGYAGETAANRMLRLAEEQDIDLEVIGNEDDTAAIDAQKPETFLDLLRSAAGLDQGILGETRNVLRLSYRTLSDLYNQAPGVSVAFAQLQPGFRPATDDLGVTNDVVASRPGGATAEYAIPDGDWFHYSTEQPPDGAGFRDTQDSVPAAVDGQLLPQAGWRAHVGAWREKRFAQVTFELAKSGFSSEEITAINDLRLGDLIVIDTTGAPAYVPYDEVRLMVRGSTETLNRFLHTITFNTTPADIYEVEQVEAAGSQLQNTIDNDDTSLLISPPSEGPAWSTSSTDLPYNIQINGDPCRVTAISTGTPTFVAAGANAAGNNASVAPALPAGIAAGNLMLLFAGIRNSGTGTVDLPTGWSDLVNFGNIRLMYRYYRSGDSAPTVTFTGGVANADTFGRTFGFTNLSHVIASGTKADPAAATSLNSSAQNMAYSGITLPSGRTGVSLIFAWKQDDWTGVAPPTGFTEMDDTAATTGDDIGHAAYYDLTGVTEAAGSLVVTGGAAAISRTIALHLRPTQTATVTRNIAGVATSHSPGEEIRGWRMGVTGL